MHDTTFTAFVGTRQLFSGPLPDLLRALKAHADGPPVLVFDDRTGRQHDFDLRGTLDDVLERYAPPRKGRGRPRLGVVPREITLLPRQWEWLDAQRGGASAALRRLVDEARKNDGGKQERVLAAQSAERFLLAVAGDRPHFEEATRALYAGDRARFTELVARYPKDVREHALRLAEAAFRGEE